MRPVALLFMIVILSAGPATRFSHAQTAADYAPFIGSYVGQVVFPTEKGFEKRDLSVTIQQERSGFSVEWSTVTQKPNGKLKSANYFVAFRPSKRPGFYAATGKINRFGTQVPIDPLDGDPQMLAKIQGNKMTVYATLIDEDGKHEVQTYERILVPGGMTLDFKRVVDGTPMKSIQVDLQTKEQTINTR